MDLNKYKDQLDKVNYENKTFKLTTIILACAVLVMGFAVVNRLNNEKVVVLPPTSNIKEFWVQGDMVSTSYLEMMADVIIHNMVNVSATQRPNLEFLYTMVPGKYYNAVRASVEQQINYVVNNGISQVFYTKGYETKHKGYIIANGALKQIIGDTRIHSEAVTIQISYNVEYGRFWITGIRIFPEGRPNEQLGGEPVVPQNLNKK